jgi:polyferredoxin
LKRQKVRIIIIFISFLLFPITIYYFSPALIVMGASEGIIVGSFIVFTLQFLFSLFLGRMFCGWICPAGGLQECCSFIVDKSTRGGKYNWIKYFIWVPWMSIIVAFFISAGGFHKIDFTFETTNGISLAEPHSYIVYYFFIGLIVFLSLLVGKRASCHYICWMAPFMIIGTKIKDLFGWPSLKLIAESDKCSSCKLCDKNCPMSLNVSEMVNQGFIKNSECILCGKCVDSCPKGAISYTFSAKEISTIRKAEKHGV